MNGEISMIKEGVGTLGGSPKMVQPLRMLTWAQSEYDMESRSDEGFQEREKEDEHQEMVAKKAQGGEEV
jgi:hypothetical protein